jgi:3D (Asp-Asp-Asp) domain-containing protein
MLKPREGIFYWETTPMSIHLRRWGIAIGLITAFAFPHLATEAQNIPSPASAATKEGPAATSSLIKTGDVRQVLHLKITAYTSLPDETKSYGSPFITADGTYVHDGVVATNLLPFGTKVMIPALYGNKIFTVHDRMSAKLMQNMDIWMPTKRQAVIFGVHYADVVVLASHADLSLIHTKNAAESLALANETMAAGSITPGPSVHRL